MPPLDKLSGLKRLSGIHKLRDIPPLSRAIFPGAHCPLFGAAMVLAGISDALALVIGPEECTYYTKDFTIRREGFGGIDGRCVSFTLNHNDIALGCGEALANELKEVILERNPAAVFLITTCLIEITGEDIESVGRQAEAETGVPVLVIHTEHFICENHLAGMERTLAACAELAEPPKREPSGVNLLGGRLGQSEGAELIAALESAGARVRTRLPSSVCSISDLRSAARAKANVVLDAIALPYAKRLKERFGIPYVMFPREVDPERVNDAYAALFSQLDAAAPPTLAGEYANARKKTIEARAVLRGQRFIYGNTTIPAFAFVAFLARLGMEPVLMQTRDWKDEDEPLREAILRAGFDPYVTRSANLAPIRALYGQLQPRLYIGHEDGRSLKAQGIAQVTSDTCGDLAGFDLSCAILDLLMEAMRDA
ncbi:MAG: nitrogenase component 1 [Oscillospiraceae bacterium]|jgi:nitrogenase molybdenum-cofactor synthesis protein NifE|nr:nitrogenase component 1 [Oscillospiraceae bacterium]